MRGQEKYLNNNLKCINVALLTKMYVEVLRLSVHYIRYTKNLNYYSLQFTQKNKKLHHKNVTSWDI